MGTNYYWYKEKQTARPIPEGLHIGKCSAGWVFHFQAHKDIFQRQNLMSYYDYKEFLKKGFIYNEYEEEVPYSKFIKLVESTKKQEDGKEPWTFENNPDNVRPIDSTEEWMDSGFMFTKGDFC